MEKDLEKDFNDREILDGFSVFSHEIRTPVNLIYSTAKIINANNKKGNLSDESINRYTDNIINNCNRISLIINNLISVNQCDFIRFESIDLEDFAKKFSDNIDIYAEEYNFKYECKTKCRRKFYNVPLDCMERILLNLITNAVKYNDKEEKKVTLNITEDEDYIYFTVKDNGNGIDEKYIESVTNKFFRANKNVSGMGLGLFIVKSSVEKFGGKLKISSKIKKGTEVSFSVPQKLSGEMLAFCGENSEYIPSKSTFGVEFSTLKENL